MLTWPFHSDHNCQVAWELITLNIVILLFLQNGCGVSLLNLMPYGESLLSAKYYFPDCTWPSPISRGSSKARWRSICHYMDLVVDRVFHRLGDGGSTSFWHDS